VVVCMVVVCMVVVCSNKQVRSRRKKKNAAFLCLHLKASIYLIFVLSSANSLDVFLFSRLSSSSFFPSRTLTHHSFTR